MSKITLFSQVLHHLDRNIFKIIVRKHQTDKYSKGIDNWTHLVSMLFMQFADATSVRDISNGLRSATGDLNHLGVKKAPCKSSISYINANRSYKIFEEYFYALLDKLEPSLQRKRQYATRLKRKIYIMDGSVIPLCLSLFDWAKFRTSKGGIKLHAVLDYDTGLPCFATITEAKTHEIKEAKGISFPSGSIVVMDRGYVDYQWLFNLVSYGVNYVTRIKSNAVYEVNSTFETNKKSTHIISDENIVLTSEKGQKAYPKELRKVVVYDAENDKILELITNNLSWTAETISQLYKARWDIEVFFKALKQLFRVKSFVGTSTNAVRIQMWISLIAMLILTYLKRKAKYKWHMANLIAFLRINLFVKIELWYWLNQPFKKKIDPPPEFNLFSIF